jgi:hypothetical protein
LSTGENTAERITVGLIRKVSNQLEQLQSTGLSKTDIVNRSISLYAFVTAEQDAGNEILVRNDSTGNLERIRLL